MSAASNLSAASAVSQPTTTKTSIPKSAGGKRTVVSIFPNVPF